MSEECRDEIVPCAPCDDGFKKSRILTIRGVQVMSGRDFLVMDGKELYHVGTSLKDLGRNYCAVTKMDPMFIESIMRHII